MIVRIINNEQTYINGNRQPAKILDKYTKEQLEQNANAAYDAYDYACAAAAAYACTYAAAVDYWLDRYFKYSGENKQDYIDAINKGNKQ